MTHAELVRLEHGSQGTFGVLKLNGEVFCTTIERPPLGNQPNVSCIPTGPYACERIVSPRFGETFEVTRVPGRTHIIFHAGNTITDSKGCILLGRSFGRVGGKRAVISSRAAVADFLAALSDVDTFNLMIRSVL